MAIKPLTHVDDLRRFGYLHIQEECSLYKTHQSTKTSCRLYLTLRASCFETYPICLNFISSLSYNIAYHFHVSHISITQI